MKSFVSGLLTIVAVICLSGWAGAGFALGMLAVVKQSHVVILLPKEVFQKPEAGQ